MSKFIQFQKDMDFHLSKTSKFIVRCIVVMLCVCYVLNNYCPRYEFMGSAHRVNKVTGKSEHYDNYRGWQE